MPKKRNGAGQDQEYVPAGNGDASGEYADDSGQNRHFVVFANPLPSNFNTSKAATPKNPRKKTAKYTLQQKVDEVLNSQSIKTGTQKLKGYKRNALKYQYGIAQAMAEQGFDGLPQVVDPDVFDDIVKKSKFVAQRGVGANTKSQLDLYTDQLYNGEWYVTCNVGGAQYGQGMYCAADYTGKITRGMTSEAQDYAGWNQRGGNTRIETLTLAPDAKIVKHAEMIADLKEKMSTDPDIYDGVHERIALSTLRNIMYAEIPTKDWGKIGSWTLEDWEKKYPSETEYVNHEVEYQLTGDVKRHKKLDKQRTSSLSRSEKLAKNDIRSSVGIFEKAANGAGKGKINDPTVSNCCRQVLGLNDGELATLLGYDAINAEGHGPTGSYTVILNRTKTIFRKQ